MAATPNTVADWEEMTGPAPGSAETAVPPPANKAEMLAGDRHSSEAEPQLPLPPP